MTNIGLLVVTVNLHLFNLCTGARFQRCKSFWIFVLGTSWGSTRHQWKKTLSSLVRSRKNIMVDNKFKI